MTNKTIKLAFVACCGLYLGACGKDAPSATDLLGKFNQILTCQKKTTLPALTTADINEFNNACSEADRKALGEFLDCGIAKTCNSGPQCNPVSISSTCKNTLGLNSIPGFAVLPQ